MSEPEIEATTTPTAAEGPATPEPAPPKPRAWGRITLGAALLAGLALVYWRYLGPLPDLEPARRLAEAGDYPAARAKLASILAWHPSYPAARLAMAEVLMNLDVPEPAEAIRNLDQFPTSNRQLAAFAQVVRGKAEWQLHHLARAEAAWREALRLDRFVGEAGWLLIDLYLTEGRTDELRRLALGLHRVEPDPDDRVRLLLEPSRVDAEPLSAGGVIPFLEAAVAADPGDRAAALACYRAMAHNGTNGEEAARRLRELWGTHPDDPAVLDGLLFALMVNGDIAGASEVMASLPPATANDPRLASARGWLAEQRGDLPLATREYALAAEREPSDETLLHHLAQAYRAIGQEKRAAEVAAREQAVESARIALRGIKGKQAEAGRPGLFDEAIQRPNLGRAPDPALYKRLAANREAMGHADEALAWYRLAADADPADAESRQAVARLEGTPSP